MRISDYGIKGFRRCKNIGIGYREKFGATAASKSILSHVFVPIIYFNPLIILEQVLANTWIPLKSIKRKKNKHPI